jgi:sortase A
MKRTTKRSKLIYVIGILFILSGILMLVFTFYPIIKQEILYEITEIRKLTSQIQNSETSEILPINKDFSIVIPKINANAPVISNVDPYSPSDYQKKLAKGVAHAKNSAFPDTPGNVFLFAHSANDFYNANRYNAIFYLLKKLEQGDKIHVYYHDKKYTYSVTDTVMVTPDFISYLEGTSDKHTLTLMTCWPPGTSWRRLLVNAKLIMLDGANYIEL